MQIDQFIGKYRYLSNFYPSFIIYGDIEYATVEHAFQAQKTKNMTLRQDISKLLTPSEAKSRGKRVILRPDWEKIKEQIMEDLVRLKFQIPELRQKLILTGEAELIEGNEWHDIIWGVCNGVGENKLGKILMKIRKEIIDADVAKIEKKKQ